MDKKLFNELLKEDVDQYIEKKGKFNYIAWPNAIILITNHPLVEEFSFLTMKNEQTGQHYWKDPDTHHVTVKTQVTINGWTQECSLAVTDNKNNSIIDPSVDQIVNAEKRCLVKNIGLFGLGLKLWVKEALHDRVGATPKKAVATPKKKSSKKKIDNVDNPSPSDGEMESSREDIHPLPELSTNPNSDFQVILQSFNRTKDFWNGQTKRFENVTSVDGMKKLLTELMPYLTATQKKYVNIYNAYQQEWNNKKRELERTSL
tara:strand:- start:5840 stop:6619 length:780 start_codon:yes stop_codon:yes gene_type:complete